MYLKELDEEKKVLKALFSTQIRLGNLKVLA